MAHTVNKIVLCYSDVIVVSLSDIDVWSTVFFLKKKKSTSSNFAVNNEETGFKSETEKVTSSSTLL